mmetsp:Transcript_4039/g.12663  ORF Transcript_4039/g.12663 Transcript_4039/m.12663 type:complete len:111 (-) Transcript_4039:112-444(-)
MVNTTASRARLPSDRYSPAARDPAGKWSSRARRAFAAATARSVASDFRTTPGAVALLTDRLILVSVLCAWFTFQQLVLAPPRLLNRVPSLTNTYREILILSIVTLDQVRK